MSALPTGGWCSWAPYGNGLQPQPPTPPPRLSSLFGWTPGVLCQVGCTALTPSPPAAAAEREAKVQHRLPPSRVQVEGWEAGPQRPESRVSSMETQTWPEAQVHRPDLWASLLSMQPACPVTSQARFSPQSPVASRTWCVQTGWSRKGQVQDKER